MYSPSRSLNSPNLTSKQAQLWLWNWLSNGLEALVAMLQGLFNPDHSSAVPGLSVWSNRLLLIYAIPLFFIFGAMAIPMLVVYQLFFHFLIQMALRIS